MRKSIIVGRGESKSLITKLFHDETTPLLEEITNLKGQNETMKSLLRTAEEALRKETELRQQYQALLKKAQRELNQITNLVGMAERKVMDE